VKTVLVLDGKSRAALQIVRSLGKKGVKIIVGNEHWACSSFFSKYVSKRIVYPNPNTVEFRHFMFEFLKNNKIDLVIPVRDDTTLFCSKHKDKLNQFTKVFVADYETIMIGRDKSNTFKKAKKLGIPHPKTEIATNKSDLLNTKIEYPLVLKPAFSSGSRGLFIVKNKFELIEVSDNLFKDYDKYLIQDYISTKKKVVGVNVLFDDNSKPIAIFTYKRLREYPRGNGPSVLRESTYEPEIRDITLKLFKGLKWKGVAMVEYKIDEKDNKPKLIEINPRFWGSLALPIFAGVDFPYLLYNVALGRKVEKISSYKVGVKARWLLLGDLLWLLKSRNKYKDLKDFIKFFDKKQTYDIISWNDPLPALGSIIEGFYFIFNSDKRKHAFGR